MSKESAYKNLFQYSLSSVYFLLSEPILTGEVVIVHSKKTVKYTCEIYPSGNKYFFKQEMITFSSWDDVTSLQWGCKRPVTQGTFDKRKKEGYRTYEKFIHKGPALVLQFSNLS